MAITAAKLHAVGRRKEAVARAFLSPGTGNVTVNGRPVERYFVVETLRAEVQRPFLVTNTVGKYDVNVSVTGGGLSGQAGAVRHAVARALLEVDADLRLPLKQAGLLTRDPRMKERKKYGLKKARKRPQFSKR